MKKLLAFTLLALSGAVFAGDDSGEAPRNKPYVMVDSSMERDASTLANDYINVNLTMGVKTPSKTEFSVKVGASAKDVSDPSKTNALTNNIEFKVKQSFDVGAFFLPYVSVRLGEKFDYDTTHFTHYAFDAGLKLPLSDKLALDVGARYRNSFDTAKLYRSTRIHAMVLFDIDKSNTVGLRYTQSDAQSYTEERKGWRVHYQRNY
ncbi:MAG: hypothetical protein NTZ96_06270 [Burkholderiales bacterium]|nr:hypothetical protein [Burkholderiales bacterium]